MKKKCFDIQKDGFYGTYYEAPQGSDCVMIGLFGDGPNDFTAKCGEKWLQTALILCIIEISVIVIASPMAKPSVVLRFLPKDVQSAAKDHPEPPKYKQMIAHMLLAFFLLSMLSGIIFLGIDGAKSGCGFGQLTGRFMLMLYIMKTFDIIVQDQWLVMTAGYFKKLFPETAECEGWKNRGFNNKAQIVRIIA